MIFNTETISAPALAAVAALVGLASWLLGDEA